MSPPLLNKHGEILDQEWCGFNEKVHGTVNYTRCHYIPHYAACKDSSTTLVSIVQDCSCHQARDQPSLHNCLLRGQPQLNDLCCIILRFRLHSVELCAGIKKVFQHIQLHKDNRDWTRFLWLSDPQDPNSEFVTYRSSPIWCHMFTIDAECCPTLSSRSVKLINCTEYA